MKNFNSMFKEKNLAIHQLKKDMCDTCKGFKTGNVTEFDYQAHLIRKDNARAEKARDKLEASEGKCIVLTVDLQAVKVCPFVTASAVYYKTKLALHNYSVYDLTTHHVMCYWFTEVDADLTASTYASLLTDYLVKYCIPKRLPIIVYSDGCTGQNRNNVLSNALLNFSMQHNVTIIQKYLEVGHTQMEGDSVHSAIERKLKNRLIHLPSDYLSATLEARQKPYPYETTMIDYDFIKDYTDTSTWRYNSIRPGRKPGDPKVTDIKALMYVPEGQIQYKTSHSDDWQSLPQRVTKIPIVTQYKQLHRNKLPITDTKFAHLQELKSVIPVDCHVFYDALPHN